MKKSRPESGRVSWGTGWKRHAPTDNQALHFVFLHHIDVEDLLHSIVKLEGAAASGHDTQLLRGGTIELGLGQFQLVDKVDAQVDTIGLKVEEI